MKPKSIFPTSDYIWVADALPHQQPELKKVNYVGLYRTSQTSAVKEPGCENYQLRLQFRATNLEI